MPLAGDKAELTGYEINYAGPSMNPTFRDGDRLWVIPYGKRRIRSGDVIVFCPPADACHVVHRVIAVSPSGMKTRGDNNHFMDPWILRSEDIFGRVVSAGRAKSRVRISGGARGRLSARLLRIAKQADAMISAMLRPIYLRIAKSGIIIRLVSQRVKPRVVCFKQPKGIEMQLLLGRRVIGRRLPGQALWQIRRPFRLFVDEAALPDQDNKLGLTF
jgi:hypothetical protein